MKRVFRTRTAEYPDLETAIALGDPDWTPEAIRGKRAQRMKPRGPKTDNRLWLKYTAEADALLAYVQSSPLLLPHLRTALADLSVRQFMLPRPESPPPIVREKFALEQRRRYFIVLFHLTLPNYLVDHPDAPPSFSDKPRYLSVAFRRACVREHFRITFGNPDHMDA